VCSLPCVHQCCCLQADKPFFGICLGMQLLFDGSDESGGHEGLGIIKGKVRVFDTLFHAVTLTVRIHACTALTPGPANKRRVGGHRQCKPGGFSTLMEWVVGLGHSSWLVGCPKTHHLCHCIPGLVSILGLHFDQGLTSTHRFAPILLPPVALQVGEFDTAKGLPVPHIGWNTLHQLHSSDLLAAVAPTDRVYFVHSFRCEGAACVFVCGGKGARG
jgi:hypothetical protein